MFARPGGLDGPMTHVSDREVQKAVERLREAARDQGQGDVLVITILREITELIKKRRPSGSALSAKQIDYLVESGAFSEPELASIQASVANGDLAAAEHSTRLNAISETLSAAEVALRLGIDSSRVRHRQAEGYLYSFLVGGKRRYPLWQFTGDALCPELPGLEALVKAIPEDMQPAGVQGFISTPQASLSLHGEPLTPGEWLRQGGDTQPVIDVLDSLVQS
jgi:hypothetical protein